MAIPLEQRFSPPCIRNELSDGFSKVNAREVIDVSWKSTACYCMVKSVHKGCPSDQNGKSYCQVRNLIESSNIGYIFLYDKVPDSYLYSPC